MPAKFAVRKVMLSLSQEDWEIILKLKEKWGLGYSQIAKVALRELARKEGLIK